MGRVTINTTAWLDVTTTAERVTDGDDLSPHLPTSGAPGDEGAP